jgi:Glycosyl hydrolases family 25
MTIFYPDISGFQFGISMAGTAIVCIKATEGTAYLNADFGPAVVRAHDAGAWPFAYHFLHEGDVSAQARWAYQYVSRMPLMLDWEPEPAIGSTPTLADATGFIDSYRVLGGICYLVYHPRWYWEQLGSPSLEPLVSRKMSLASSEYTAYSATGPGWTPYGGMSPVAWQYTDSQEWNGQACDFNAFRGSAQTFQRLVSGTSVTPPQPPPPEEDDELMVLDESLAPGEAQVTPVPAGKTKVILYADYGYGSGHKAPEIRVGSSPKWAEADLKPSWNAPASWAFPAGTTALTLGRMDPGNTHVTVDFA